jgi:GNAT superfamily N-acetyltransferase
MDVKAATFKTGKPVETCRKNGAVTVLLAHIVATKTTGDVVSDDAMDFPRDWETVKQNRALKIGHREEGRTICVHSLAVVPGYQGRGLGRILLTAYLQQMNGAGIADRVAIIAHDVSFFPNMLGLVRD